MTYQDQLEETASATAAQVLAALALYEAGKLTAETFAAVVVAYLQAGNAAAATLADLSLAAVLTARTGTVVPPLGVGPTKHAVDVTRLDKAVGTMLQLDNPTPARWQRLADGEAKESAARAYSAAVKASPLVEGWVRGRDADPCQLCTWWWREGRVWPAEHPMPTHTGCTCQPVPVLAEQIKPVRYH